MFWNGGLGNATSWLYSSRRGCQGEDGEEENDPRELSETIWSALRENEAALILGFVADFYAWKIAHLAAEAAA